MSHEKAKSYVYRNTVRPMFSRSKKFSGTMDIRPEFSKCDHGDCYSFVFGLPFYDQNAQGKTSHDKRLIKDNKALWLNYTFIGNYDEMTYFT